MLRRHQFMLMLIVLGSLLWAANSRAQSAASADAVLKAAILEAYTAKMQVLDTSIDSLFRLQEMFMVAYAQRHRTDEEIQKELRQVSQQIQALATTASIPSMSGSCSSISDCNLTLEKMRVTYYTWRNKEFGECVQQLLKDTSTAECR